MTRPSASPGEIGASLWRNRALVTLLAKREALGRYKGSLLGIAWSFLHPLLMLSVYTFVFSTVFKARWTQGADSSGTTLEYALHLFAGILIYTLFAECVTRAPALVLGSAWAASSTTFKPWRCAMARIAGMSAARPA